MVKKNRPKPTTWYGKAWHFIWHEDSALSWVVNFVIAIILIKFVVYPGLGLLMGTNYPIVAVVSNSMDHHGENFDFWWSQNKNFYIDKGITKEMFEDYSFKNGFSKGDLILLVGIDKEDFEKGKVVVFMSKKTYPIIHRVVELEEDTFGTKGDANKMQITLAIDPDHVLDETKVPYEQALGKAVFKIPLVGWIKIWAANFLGLFGINIG